MARQYVAFRRIYTSASLEDVQKACESVLQQLGGSLLTPYPTIKIADAKAGSGLAYATNIEASAFVQSKGDSCYEILCQIRITRNAVFWIGALLGLLIVFFWFFPISYFLYDPSLAYQRALDRIELPPTK